MVSILWGLSMMLALYLIGFMDSVREELRDGWATNESAEEHLASPESTIIEEISGENFIIQITEMTVIKQEDNTATTAIHLPSHTSTNQVTTFSQNAAREPQHPAKVIGEGTETFTSQEKSEDSLFCSDAGTSSSLESPGDGLVSLCNETSILRSLRGSRVDGQEHCIKTEDVSEDTENTHQPCSSGSVWCHPTEVLAIGNEGQTPTTELVSGKSFGMVGVVSLLWVQLYRKSIIHLKGHQSSTYGCI